MSDTSRIIRKFERMMEKSSEELMQRRKPRSKSLEKDGKIIGYFTYDFENQTETYTPLTN